MFDDFLLLLVFYGVVVLFDKCQVVVLFFCVVVSYDVVVEFQCGVGESLLLVLLEGFLLCCWVDFGCGIGYFSWVLE